jgi:transposase
MAGKIKPMSQIKQLLQFYKQGKCKRFIARTLGISKNTVKLYIAKTEGMKLGIDDLLELEDPILEGLFHTGNPAYKDERYEALKIQFDYFQRELKQVGVNKRLLWEEYRLANPDGYGYTQFCYHLSQQKIAHRKPSAVLPHEPGNNLYIDFAGKKLSYVDKQTGEIIKCPVFVACLPYSDYCFVMVVRSQGIVDFIYALTCCLEFFSGTPRILVPDNLKSAITKTSTYEPDINRALEDFANHYGAAVVPARVASPQDKALVENQVKTIYTRVYAKLRKQQFFCLSSLNEAVLQKTREHNQTRMQIKPYCREEKFLADEKHCLTPLPEQRYEMKFYRELTVAKNNHIYFSWDRHYYSVPYIWIGSSVKVIYTRTMVRIYAQSQQVAIHPRSYIQGDYSTIKEHLCSHHQHYLDRSPDYYMKLAQKKSPELHTLVQLLFGGGRPPEQNYRTCNGLFNLHRKTEPEIFRKACLAAIECRSYSYKFLERLIKNISAFPDHDENKQNPPLPDHENIRGKEYYIQSLINFKP